MKPFYTFICAALALASAACSRGGADTADSFRWTDQLPPGSVLNIRNGAGDIQVTRAAGPSVVVHGTRSWRRSRASDVRFVVEQSGSNYYVCAMWRNSGRCSGAYRGRNTSGFLSMFSLFHKSSDAAAAFVVEVPANVRVVARTTTGSVDIDGVAAGASARTVNGTIRATNVSGPLNFTTTNGDVRVTAASLAPQDSVQLSTTNGSVHAELPASLDGSFDLQVTNGVIETDFPIPPTRTGGRVARHFAGQIGTAARPVRLRTVNGSVTLRSRGVVAGGQ